VPIARAALGVPATSATAGVAVTRWTYTRLRSSLGPATGGLFRVHGTAHVSDAGTAEDSGVVHGGLDWSAVLKVLRPPADPRRVSAARKPGHGSYWRREALAYGSGILRDLPGGLVAPRCLAVWPQPPVERDRAAGSTAQPNEEVWLWLEEVVDRYGGWWPVERTLLAARHLAEFGGAYLGKRPVPQHAWIGAGYLRQRIARSAGMLPRFEDGAIWQHPLLRGLFDPADGERLRRVWARRQSLVEALDALPQTLRHGDSHRGNLFALRPAPNAGTGRSGERTAAIDWGTLGIGPVGADLAELALSRAIAGELLAPGGSDFGERLFGSYVDGLRATGWNGDAGDVRRGYAATAALAGTSRLHWTLERALDAHSAEERAPGQDDTEEVLRRWAALTRLFLSLAGEV
jgi:hypothetical protein